MKSKKAAKEMQDRLLEDYEYDWNTIGQWEED